MDTNQDYQSFSIKKNSKPLQSLPQGYTTQPEMSDEEKVVKELSKLVAAARRRVIVIITVSLLANFGFIFLISRRPPTYEGKFQLLVEPVTIAENKLLSLLSKTLGETNARTDSGLDYESQIRVLQSPKIMNPIVENIRQKYPDINYDILKEKVKIERLMKEDEGTRILEVTYKDKKADKVEFVLDQIAQGYLKYSLEERQTNIRRGINFIEEQISTLQRQVDTIQGKLQQLRKQYNIIDPTSESKVLTEQGIGIENSRVEIQQKLAQKKFLYATLKNLFDSGNIAAVLGQDNDSYTVLLRQIHEITNKITQASTEFREDSDIMQELREQQQILRLRAINEAQSVLEKVKGEVQGLEASAQVIAQSQKVLNQRMSQFPLAVRQYTDLQRELEVATTSLNQLIVKRDGLQIDVAQQEMLWQLITPPQLPRNANNKPIAAKTTRKTYILLAIMGLVIGIAAAVMVELINNVFHTPEEIEEESKFPLLAVIPFAHEVKRLAKKYHAIPIRAAAVVANFTQQASRYLLIRNGNSHQRYIDSPVIEAFRSLYTNIRLQSPDKPIQSLAIGSATPGDGKSTVAVYLAQTAAAIGQRVLLVDADLRRPKIHTKLGLPNVRGLSEIISTDIGLNEVIQKSPSEENLFVLTAGSIPPDPVKLLSAEKMRHLMEQFQAFFDLVIYDTPPLVGLADAHLVAAYTDGLVMVVGLEKTDRFMVIKSLDRLSISGVDVLGIVANGVKGYKAKVYKAYQRV